MTHTRRPRSTASGRDGCDPEPERLVAGTDGPATAGPPGLVLLADELHGGRAWVEDRPGGGASFRVFVPNVPDQPTSGKHGPA